MDRTVKLSGTFVQLAEAESQVMRRSIGKQIEHWASIGAEIESSGLTVDDVKTLLLKRQIPAASRTNLDDDSLFSVLETEFISEKVLEHILAKKQPRIFLSHTSPGRIIKEFPDGRKEVIGLRRSRPT